MTRPGGLTDGGRVPLPGAIAIVVLVGLSLLAPLFPAAAGVSDTKITAFAGTGQAGYTGDGGPATSAQLKNPLGLAVDPAGRVYVADGQNNVVRRIDTNGTISTVAGKASAPNPQSAGDGGPATSATLASPRAVAVDGAGGILVLEVARVRRVDPSTGVISTIAGGGTPADGLGDGGKATAAALNDPKGIAVSPSGQVYIADTGNDRVRRIESDGKITTFAGGGSGPGLGDGGPATSAILEKPMGLAFGADGSLYMATQAGAGSIRKVDPTGKVTTVAGNTSKPFVEGAVGTDVSLPLDHDGDVPGLAVDPNGDLYIADSGAHTVRRLQPDGRIFTLAGNGTEGSTGDNGPAISASLSSPAGVAVLSTGVVVVADSGGNRVRRIQAPPLSIDDATVTEGNSGVVHAVLTVTVTAHAQPFTVDWATADGTATAAGNDYVAASGTLTFAAGEWRKTIDVSVNGDVAPERDETFSIRLTHASLPYPDVAGTVTIKNDDGGLPVLSVGDASAVETGGLVFTVTKTGSTPRTVQVAYSTADGTAKAPADYTATAGTLTFAPNETTKTVTVPVVDDEVQEPDETLTLALSSPAEASLDPDHASATGTILDDDVARWVETGPLDGCGIDHGCVGRDNQTATSLDGPACHAGNAPSWCGKVLIAGGIRGYEGPGCDSAGSCGTIHFPPQNSAVLYDPNTGTVSPTSAMHVPRAEATATLLADGRVLVAFGFNSDAFLDDGEVYDPNTGQWTQTAHAATGRIQPTAALLPDGTVLEVGGTYQEQGRPPVKDAEIYDPATNAWRHCTAAAATRGCPAPLPDKRLYSTSVPLPDGRVMFLGGYGPNPDHPDGFPFGDTQNLFLPAENTAFVYDPATGGWSTSTPMLTPRFGAFAFVINTAPCGDLCGKILVVGGDREGASPTAEVFDPKTATWRFTGSPAFTGNAVALAGGTILLTDSKTGAAQVFDPATEDWRDTHGFDPRLSYTQTALDGPACRRPSPPTWCGTALLAGGIVQNTSFTEMALYTPEPVARSLNPASGPSAGGNHVVITGSNLAGTQWVKFGTVKAASFTVDSPTQITATAPAEVSGAVHIAVRTPAGGLSAPDTSDTYTYGVSQAPSRITDLAAKAAGDADVDLTWSAAAADGANPPPAENYVVKIAKTPIADQASFDAAPALCGGTCSFVPAKVGDTLSLAVHKLSPGTTYHFAVRAVNGIGLPGAISNEAVATTTGQAPAEPAPAPATATTTTVAPTTATTAPAATSTQTTAVANPNAAVKPVTPASSSTPVIVPGLTAPATPLSPVALAADAPLDFGPVVVPAPAAPSIVPANPAFVPLPTASAPAARAEQQPAPQQSTATSSPPPTGTTVPPTPTTAIPATSPPPTAGRTVVGASGRHGTPVWAYVGFGIVGFAGFAFLGAFANRRLRGPGGQSQRVSSRP